VGGRGRRHGVEERRRVLELIDEAVAAGARQSAACRELGLDRRTVQRWQAGATEDLRSGPKSAPRNRIEAAQKQRLMALLTSPRFRELPPKQIVPTLADEGIYVASEATMYRMLRRERLLTHRSNARPRQHHRPPELVAAAPNTVWCWDITYLRSPIRGSFYYLYLIEDLYSRRIVGWQVLEHESADDAATLVERTCSELDVDGRELHLHSDNGGPMKGATMLATLQRLGVVASFSRPRVSDDNPFAESLFRTLKYRPGFPSRPFRDIEEARQWVTDFVRWYNTAHLHSALNFVTPDDRYFGRDAAILAARHLVYQRARRRHPRRWTGETRNWSPAPAVTLNPSRVIESK
jgi:transposase InsO family protein